MRIFGAVTYLIAALVFLLPFGAYALWRQRNPEGEPSRVLLAAAVVGVAAALGSAAWYGLGRREAPGLYVPPHVEGGQIVPGHTEPRR